MLRFKTESGSLYELDQEANLVRRLLGTKDATLRQGVDGEWKKLARATDVIVGSPVLFVWEVEKLAEDFINLKSTLTTTVVEILN